MDDIEMEDIGDNYCDQKLNIKECSWDGGDCSQAINCQVTDKSKLSDGKCDGGDYNSEACGWDGGTSQSLVFLKKPSTYTSCFSYQCQI